MRGLCSWGGSLLPEGEHSGLRERFLKDRVFPMAGSIFLKEGMLVGVAFFYRRAFSARRVFFILRKNGLC